MINDMAITRRQKDKFPDDQRAYTGFLFMVGTIVAHELMHSFIRFLAGPFSSRTPVKLTHDPDWGSKSWGESGFAFAARLFGGTPLPFRNSKNPLGNRQAGEMWFRLCHKAGTWAMVDTCSDCVQ